MSPEHLPPRVVLGRWLRDWWSASAAVDHSLDIALIIFASISGLAHAFMGEWEKIEAPVVVLLFVVTSAKVAVLRYRLRVARTSLDTVSARLAQCQAERQDSTS